MQDIAKRREGAVRGCMTLLDQSEHFLFISSSAMKAGKRARLHIPSQSTASIVMGPVHLPDLSSVWQLTLAQKKKLYGTARILPGGPAPVAAKEAASVKPRVDSTLEPVSFHGSAIMLWEELLNTIAVIKPRSPIPCIIDLTLGDATLACLAVELGIPYLGVAFNNDHADAARIRLKQHVFKLFMNPKSPLYKPDLCATLQLPKNSGTPAASADAGAGSGPGTDGESGAAAAGNAVTPVGSAAGGGASGGSASGGSAGASGNNQKGHKYQKNT